MATEIDQFIDSGLEALQESDFVGQYPFSFLRLLPYVSDLRSKKVLQTIQNLKKRQIPLNKIAQSFPTLPTIRIEAGLTLIDLKIACFSRSERLGVFNFFNNLIKERAKEDFYGKKSNISKSQEEVKEIMKNINFFTVSQKDAKNIGFLSAALASLSWALYNDNFPNQSYEIEGPYQLGRKSQLLIKRNIRLNPTGLFEHASGYKHGKVDVYVVYDDLNAQVDAMNHLVYHGNAVNAMKKAAIFVDGKPIKKSTILSLAHYFGKLAQEQFAYTENLSFEEKKKLFLFQREYALKDFFTLAEIDWNPSQTMIDRIHNKKLLTPPKFKSKQEEHHAIVKMFDPRIDLPLSKKVGYHLFRLLYAR